MADTVSIILTIFCLAVMLAGGGIVIALLYGFALVSHRMQGPRLRQSKGSKTLVYNTGQLEKWFL